LSAREEDALVLLCHRASLRYAGKGEIKIMLKNKGKKEGIQEQKNRRNARAESVKATASYGAHAREVALDRSNIAGTDASERW
jgi:hypothetical protein